jgi:hypothetical protein
VLLHCSALQKVLLEARAFPDRHLPGRRARQLLSDMMRNPRCCRVQR